MKGELYLKYLFNLAKSSPFIGTAQI